jgi:hypothetical protein
VWYTHGNGASDYIIGLEPGITAKDLNKPEMGYLLPFTHFEQFGNKGEFKDYIYVYSESSSAKFFASQEAKDIRTIIKSFKLN